MEISELIRILSNFTVEYPYADEIEFPEEGLEIRSSDPSVKSYIIEEDGNVVVCKNETRRRLTGFFPPQGVSYSCTGCGSPCSFEPINFSYDSTEFIDSNNRRHVHEENCPELEVKCQKCEKTFKIQTKVKCWCGK